MSDARERRWLPLDIFDGLIECAEDLNPPALRHTHTGVELTTEQVSELYKYAVKNSKFQLSMVIPNPLTKLVMP